MMSRPALRCALVVAMLLCKQSFQLTFAAADSNVIPPGYVAKPAVVQKYALVIGAENYRYFPKVENALSDGAAVHQALLKAGYTFVRFLPDPANVDIIIDRLTELAQQAHADSKPAVVTVYYAGHGFQAGASNYIVPTGARDETLTQDSLPISTILRKVSSGRFSFAIVFVDACRTVKTLDATNIATSLSPNRPPGYQTMPEAGNAVIGMAAGKGFAAQSIGNNRPENSPYAGALSSNIPIDSVPLAVMFDRVRSYVLQDTGQRQKPVEVTAAGVSGFYFKPGPEVGVYQDTVWNKIVGEGARRKCLENYIYLYPAGNYRAAAEYLLERYGNARPVEPICTLD